MLSTKIKQLWIFDLIFDFFLFNNAQSLYGEALCFLSFLKARRKVLRGLQYLWLFSIISQLSTSLYFFLSKNLTKDGPIFQLKNSNLLSFSHYDLVKWVVH